jgi:hypothetical protein
MARQQKQKDKAARRLEVKERKTDAGSDVGGNDLGIAGVKPGPQPLPEQWNYLGSAE